MSVIHDDLVRSIRLYLSGIGALSIHVETPGLLFDKNGRPVKIGKKGRLDICSCVKGRFVAIDAKIGRDRLKPDQQKFADAVTRAGGIAFAAWSVDDVAKTLAAEGLA
ncbi:hypothetical protein K7W03_25655 [Sphingobium sp. PNB]|uniref:hypothetical protein n=1 Tax=Sphingobium sp. PNB TaxID=863934 RepID=UPI001CA3D074|nr:hypothetical protein [Sphingobium sp. PNB]MCB4862972.1 hypothetical protein [Sphingobium sp. PNB]